MKRKVHDYDSTWKTILEAFEAEIVELLFPEVYKKINWNIESESLDISIEYGINLDISMKIIQI